MLSPPFSATPRANKTEIQQGIYPTAIIVMVCLREASHPDADIGTSRSGSVLSDFQAAPRGGLNNKLSRLDVDPSSSISVEFTAREEDKLVYHCVDRL
jgi:hypothetical protein